MPGDTGGILALLRGCGVMPGKAERCWDGLPAPPAGMHRLTLQASTQVPPQHQPKIRQDHKEEGPPELQAAALGGKSLKLAWNFTFT